MKEIVFATHNLHKTDEVRAILGADYHILNLPELGCPDIPETADTLKGKSWSTTIATASPTTRDWRLRH